LKQRKGEGLAVYTELIFTVLNNEECKKSSKNYFPVASGVLLLTLIRIFENLLA
jgi:hypothetical protein